MIAVGISHRTAPVALRERLFLPPERAAELARSLARDHREAVVLSTCNRTEVYVAEDAAGGRPTILSALAACAGVDVRSLRRAAIRLENEAADVHLLRVAAGLESLVPGEPEILGQVRRAWGTAQRERTAGRTLNALFRAAVRTGKRVRSETAIARHPASIPSAAIALAARALGGVAGRRVLVVGAGKMAALTCASLRSAGVGTIVVANRTPANAARLAERFGAEAVSLAALEDELAAADIVVCSAGSPAPLVTLEQLQPGRRRRPHSRLALIDLGVPRNIDARVRELPACVVYDLDDLESVIVDSVGERLAETARAEAIVAEEAARLSESRRADVAAPTIALLRRRAEHIRRRELRRARARLSRLPERDREVVEALTARIVNTFLHDPTVRLRAGAGPEGALDAETVRRLFCADPRPDVRDRSPEPY